MKSDSIKTARYASKRNTKVVKIDMYLDDPTEAKIYQQWQKEPHKKELFLKMYIEHLAAIQK